MHRRTVTWVALTFFALVLFAGSGCQVLQDFYEKYGKPPQEEAAKADTAACPAARAEAPAQAPAQQAEPAKPTQAQPQAPAASAPVAVAPAQEGPTEGEVSRFESANVHFEFDSAVLSDDSRRILRAKANFLQRYPRFQVRLEGHCDERGSNEYNLALGERRAWSVKEYLVGLGVDPDRLATISYGEERPVDPAHTEAAWAKNRRVHCDLW